MLKLEAWSLKDVCIYQAGWFDEKMLSVCIMIECFLELIVEISQLLCSHVASGYEGL